MEGHCKHCRRMLALVKRGLCQSCFDDGSVRDQYLPLVEEKDVESVMIRKRMIREKNEVAKLEKDRKRWAAALKRYGMDKG